MKSYLLAVKQYKSATPCTPVRTGELVQLWAQHVLQEFGLGWGMIAGAVTDSGSDAKHAFSDIPGVLRERWSIPHMLNRAIIGAFGLALSPEKSKNKTARKIILGIRKIMERTRKEFESKSDPCLAKAGRFND